MDDEVKSLFSKLSHFHSVEHNLRQEILLKDTRESLENYLFAHLADTYNEQQVAILKE